MRKSEDSVVWYLDFWIFTATALGRMDSIPAEIQGNEEYTDENEKNNVYYAGSGHCGNLCRAGICIHKELLIPILCAIFFVEDLSVMIQVAYFKITKRKYGEGRRVFKMTPLHHHFQKPGNAGINALIQKPLQAVPESKIVVRFWIVCIMLAAITIVTLKMR